MPKAKRHQAGLLDTWGRQNRKHADKKCAECNKVFRPKRSSSKYCSRPCMWKNNGKGIKPKQEVWWLEKNKGYIVGRVRVDGKRKFYRYHRWIMEARLGRKLLPTEVVHHINGNKLDNRIENLELMTHGEHSRQHNLKRDYRKGKSL